jgi:hypothetical protein
MKESPIQISPKIMYSLLQGKVSVWIKQLVCLLEEPLKQKDKIPEREMNKFYNFLYAYVEVIMCMGVAEGRIGSSIDYQFQKDYYSCKKGCHTFKNLIITNLASKIIFFVETSKVSTYGKTLYEQADLKSTDQWLYLWMNLEVLGMKTQGVEIFMPEKKPKSKNFPFKKSQFHLLEVSV